MNTGVSLSAGEDGSRQMFAATLTVYESVLEVISPVAFIKKSQKRHVESQRETETHTCECGHAEVDVCQPFFDAKYTWEEGFKKIDLTR